VDQENQGDGMNMDLLICLGIIGFWIFMVILSNRLIGGGDE
jgi:hypothetical protein